MFKLNPARSGAVLCGIAVLVFSGSSFAATQDFLPSVTALNQKLKGDAVSITYAYLPKDGKLAIFSSDPSAKQGATPIGSVALPAGDHRDVKVTLQSEPKAGSQLWAAVVQAKTGRPFKNSDERAEQSFKAL